jgi:hypothetical protein
MHQEAPIEYRGYLLAYEACKVRCAPAGTKMRWVIKHPDGTNVTLPGDSAPALGEPTPEGAKETIDIMEELRTEGRPVTFDTVMLRWAERMGLGDLANRRS